MDIKRDTSIKNGKQEEYKRRRDYLDEVRKHQRTVKYWEEGMTKTDAGGNR